MHGGNLLPRVESTLFKSTNPMTVLVALHVAWKLHVCYRYFLQSEEYDMCLLEWKKGGWIRVKCTRLTRTTTPLLKFAMDAYSL